MDEAKHNLDRQTDTTVDILKFVFCIFIIALHTKLLEVVPAEFGFFIEKVFFRTAVPYFFVASGYYLRKRFVCKTDSTQSTILLSYIKRLLFPFSIFLFISLRQSWTTYMISGWSKTHIFKQLLKDAFVYPVGALWFVFALIIAVIIIYPFQKKRNGLNICLFAGVCLYFFALICNNYYFIVINTPLQSIIDGYLHFFVSARNGFFVGIVYVSLGMKCFDWRSEKKLLLKKRGLFVFFLFLFVLYIAEIEFLHIHNFLFNDDGSLYFTQLLFVPILFLLSVSFSLPIPISFSILFRNLSTGMYYLHRPILWWVSFYSKNQIINFLIVVIIALSICLFSYNFKFKKRYYLLK